jgi:HEAT repeat protein
MLKTARKTSKLSPFFLFPLTLFLVFLLSFSWVNAKEAPKPKPQPWQIDGILAALDDGYPKVQQLAFEKLAEYEAKDLKAVLKKPEDIAQKAANFLKDEKVDAYIRGSAASALGKLGEAGAKYAPEILNFLKDEKVDAYIRDSAASALGKLGEAGAKYAPEIFNFLKDEKVNVSVRGGAASALGKLGEAGAKYAPEIFNIFKDEKVDADVRGSAAYALGNLGEAGAKYAPEILNFLKDEKVDADVRGSAASALGNLGEAGAKYAPEIFNIFKDEKVNVSVRGNAASALGNLGEAGAKYAPEIFNFLKDEKVGVSVRYIAASALENLGEAGAKYAPEILNFLKDEKVDAYIRSNAASALGNLGEARAKYAPEIFNILKDEKVNADIRGSAASALGNLGEAGAKYAPEIFNFLKDEKVDPYARSSAASALGKIKQLKLTEVVVVLNNVYEPNQEYLNWRFLTYFLSGGTDEVKTLLTWLGIPDSKTIPTQLNHDTGVKTLNLFLKAWEASNTDKLNRLQDDLAKQIALVFRKVSWKPRDIILLQSHSDNLKKGGYNEADTVQSVINDLEYWKWFFAAKNTILIHITFWLALIFAYPKFPQVQAIFFWNPWVRRILGMGYVGFLLAWVPFLRRKLFEPFKFSLLADAGLDNFKSHAYFPQSRVKVPMTEKIKEITHELPSIKGQIVLEGDSGLGKSMFLRHLVKSSQTIVVYLPAHKCDKGVIEAIQAKLHGQAQDAEFLKNLIYSGAIDICIDGLNEVTADTRAKITQFVESYFRGNIIMTTQPLEWIPPSTAKMYYLQPLEPQQIEQFLITRQQRLPKDARIQGTAYEQACKNYLTEAFNQQQSREELEASQRTLSNPMDLTLVAQMLSQGKQPDLFRLQEQQYNSIAAEYLQEWKHEFPLKKFSEAVYQMRLNDEKALSGELFHQELQSMEDEKYKMVVSRQWLDEKGEPKKECYFRHDKIMDFFLVQTFLGDGDAAEQRLIDHMSDPRFRGVYFLLATLLHLDKAKALREDLIQYAANTKDHTVSDTFVQLLRSR